MAFVLKKNDSHKGILVLKHLEFPYLERQPDFLVNQLKKKYFVAAYIGGYRKQKRDFKYADLYIADRNVLVISESKLPRIFLNGNNFIDHHHFKPHSGIKKEFDFLFIGNTKPNKKLNYYLESISKCLEEKKGLKFLIVNRIGSDSEETRNGLNKIRKTLDELPKWKKKQICYIESDYPPGFMLPKEVISNLMSLSKALVIISDSEGSSRVVAEALLSGLNIISYSKMKGGTNNNLNDNFDYLLDNLDSLDRDLLTISENLSQRTDLEVMRSFYSQEYSKQTLVNELRKITEFPKESLVHILGMNLSNAFSSHQTSLPRSIPSDPNTDECLNELSMYRLLCYINGLPQNQDVVKSIKQKQYLRSIKSKLKKAKKKIF